MSTLGGRKGSWRFSFLPSRGGVLGQGVFVGEGGRMEDGGWKMEGEEEEEEEEEEHLERLCDSS